VNIRLFLLLDGLDEYEGQPEDYEEMTEFLCSMSTSPNIKICVSSRPLLVLEDAFRRYPGLRLQDLTYQDITQYVSDKLGNHPRFQLLSSKEPEKAPALLEEIVTKANGVFLWVKLVVRSLVAGLQNRDSIVDLQRRLFLLPADLEDLYSYMLSRIDSFYKLKACEMFQLVRAQRVRERNYWPTATVQSTRDVFTIFALAMADNESPSQILDAAIGSSPIDDILDACSEMESRLKVRCAGLLEVQHQDSKGIVDKVRWDSKVQYIHRTARDYVESNSVWHDLISKTQGTAFDAYPSLFRSGVLQLLQLSGVQESVTDSAMRGIALYTLNYARLASTTSSCSLDLIRKIDAAMCHFHGITQDDHATPHWANFLYPGESYHTFLTLAIQYDLTAYVKDTLEADPTPVERKKGRPLLDYAVNPTPKNVHGPISACTVEVILKNGADPNEQRVISTIWDKCLAWQASYNHAVKIGNWDKDLEFARDRATTLRLMLEYGADQKLVGSGPDGPYGVSSISQLFKTIAPDEVKRIESLLRSKSSPLKLKRKKGILQKIVIAVRK
jgi:hypothetical protein